MLSYVWDGDTIIIHRFLFNKKDFLVKGEKDIRNITSMMKSAISDIIHNSKTQNFCSFLLIEDSGNRVLKNLDNKIKKILENCKII